MLPPANAFLIAPAIFNTVNKLAHRMSDTLALGLLNEGPGFGRPMAAAPWPDVALARHPAFLRSIAALAGVGRAHHPRSGAAAAGWRGTGRLSVGRGARRADPASSGRGRSVNG